MPDNIVGSSNVEEAVKNASLIVLAIPTQHLPSFVKKNLSYFKDNVPLVSTAKGIHVKSHKLISNALEEVLGDRVKNIPLAYLSGKYFAIPSSALNLSYKFFTEISSYFGKNI